MTRKVVAISTDASLHKCSKLMARERVNSLFVTANRKLIGILTARDILWTITKKPGVDLRSINAMDIATKKLAVIKPSADISQALTKMKALNFRRLPVIFKSELIGVVTLKDILVVEPNLYGEMKGLMDDIREEENKVERASAEWPLQGMCDNCGVFSDLLKVEDSLLCQDCREELF